MPSSLPLPQLPACERLAVSLYLSTNFLEQAVVHCVCVLLRADVWPPLQCSAVQL